MHLEPPPPSASWAENTIVPECTQESGHLAHLQSTVVGDLDEPYKSSSAE
jgi:hypothetical protein